MPKVLVITYYWPPAGGPGVQRWLSFTKYLPEFDVQPIVFIPENPYYPITDESLLGEIPSNIICYKQKIREPYFFARLFIGSKTNEISSGIIKEESQSLLERFALWIRGNLFIPDSRKFWLKPASKKLLGIVKNENVKTIITTGPPHSVHLIGLKLQQEAGVKWIADFRDPWTSIGYHSKLKLTKASKRKHKRIEYQVLTNADKIITTSQTTKEEFSQISLKPIVVITNGYELSGMQTQDPIDEQFTLSFIGSLLSGRNPTNLWKALSQLVKENSGFRDNLRLQIIGVVSKDVLDTIYEYGLKDYSVVIPYVRHKEAKKFQRKSQLLLLLEIDSPDTIGIIPGKLFEYMAAKRPILAIGPKEWEAGSIVEETNSGVFYDYETYDSLKLQLLNWYELYKTGTLNVTANSIEQYSRRSLTEKLAKELQWA